MATATRLEHGIALLGTEGSGKTTLLGALGPAFIQGGGVWLLAAADDSTATTLFTMVTQLTSRQIFPLATSGQIMSHNWQLWGERPRAWLQRFRRPEQIRVDLHVADPSGEIVVKKSHEIEERLIDILMQSRGIIFMFDPIRDEEQGDAFDYVFDVVTRLTQRARGRDGRLQHHVAVCISKFDDRRVFEKASRLKLLTVAPGDRYQLPRIADDSHEDFFPSSAGIRGLALRAWRWIS